MCCIARGSLASPAKSGRDLYGSLSLFLGIKRQLFGEMARDEVIVVDLAPFGLLRLATILREGAARMEFSARRRV